MMTLHDVLYSSSVLSKQYIVSNGLFAVVIDDNHIYDEEGRALVGAFKSLSAKKINWSKTSNILDSSTPANIHVIECTDEGFQNGFLDIDESILYWNHLLFLDDLSAIVLHTAHDHIIYVGPKTFVNEATQRQNSFRDGWLSVIGTAFSDPELISEYGLND